VLVLGLSFSRGPSPRSLSRSSARRCSAGSTRWRRVLRRFSPACSRCWPACSSTVFGRLEPTLRAALPVAESVTRLASITRPVGVKVVEPCVAADSHGQRLFQWATVMFRDQRPTCFGETVLAHDPEDRRLACARRWFFDPEPETWLYFRARYTVAGLHLWHRRQRGTQGAVIGYPGRDGAKGGSGVSVDGSVQAQGRDILQPEPGGRARSSSAGNRPPGQLGRSARRHRRAWVAGGCVFATSASDCEPGLRASRRRDRAGPSGTPRTNPSPKRHRHYACAAWSVRRTSPLLVSVSLFDEHHGKPYSMRGGDL